MIQLLFLALFFLNQATDPYHVSCNTDVIKSAQPVVRQILCLKNKFNHLTSTAGKINVNISYKTGIGGVSILLVLLLDVSLNVLLLKGVNKRRNDLFIPWLFGQGIRILVCVTTICLTMSLYVFDISSNSVRTAENHTKEIETSSSDDSYTLQNKIRFPPR